MRQAGRCPDGCGLAWGTLGTVPTKLGHVHRGPFSDGLLLALGPFVHAVSCRGGSFGGEGRETQELRESGLWHRVSLESSGAS